MFFDPYLYSDVRSDQDLENLVYFGTHAVVICAHAPRTFEDGPRLLQYLEQLRTREALRVREAGLSCHVALGVHPHAAPKRAFDEVWEALPSLLECPSVVALGELGVDAATPSEYEHLERQMRLAVELDRPCLVRLPIENRRAVWRQILACCRRASLSPSRVLVTNAAADQLPMVLSPGCYAVVNPAAEDFDAEQSLKTDQKYPGRLCLSAALTEGPGDVLAIDRGALSLRRAGANAELTQRLSVENAERFYGIEPVSSAPPLR